MLFFVSVECFFLFINLFDCVSVDKPATINDLPTPVKELECFSNIKEYIIQDSEEKENYKIKLEKRKNNEIIIKKINLLTIFSRLRKIYMISKVYQKDLKCSIH